MNDGENQIPYGSCIFEAHLMTTLEENYYKWLFLLLSDVDEVKDEHFEGFRMEYECGDKAMGGMPKERIDYQEANSRLRQDVEIYYDENESSKRQLFKVETDGEEIELVRRRERGELEALIHGVKKVHQKMIEIMRDKVRCIRDTQNDIR